jgi:hypothetical protein
MLSALGHCHPGNPARHHPFGTNNGHVGARAFRRKDHLDGMTSDFVPHATLQMSDG